AERVADRDRAAVPIELLRVEAEPVTTVDYLRSERLVQLPDVDVADPEAAALEELRHREDRADPHLVGLTAGDREAAEDELGRMPSCFARSMDMTSVAEAPSESWDELPAVT